MPEGCVVVAEAPHAPAPWTFIVGRAFLAAVPASTGQAIVHRLTEWVTASEVSLESLVALIPVAGAGQIDSFIVIVPAPSLDLAPTRSPDEESAHPGLIAEDGVSISVVVRGDIGADLFSVGGSRRFHDRGIRPWLLADFRFVTGVVIGSAVAPLTAQDGSPPGSSAPWGAVAGRSLVWNPAAVAAEAPVDAESDTVLSVPRAAARDCVVDPIGDTVRAAGHPAVAWPEPEPETGAQPSAAPAALPPRRGFRLASGQRLTLDQSYYIGRNPRLPRVVSANAPLLLPVPAPTSAVSATHLEIRQDGTSVVVTDLGSTNGTFVTPLGGRTRRLRSGQSLAVVPGTVVNIGDGNLIEILG